MKLKRLPPTPTHLAAYEGFYEGRRVRINRLSETHWDGYVWDEAGRGRWLLVAEQYPTLQAAVYETQRKIKAPLRHRYEDETP